MSKQFDIAILYEHPEWHEPLFNVLEKQQVSYAKIDLKAGAFSENEMPDAKVYYNLVSPSAYLRGNQKAIPFAMALCRNLEINNKKVLNGTNSMSYEFSKSSQIALLKNLGIDHPKTISFNSIKALKSIISQLNFPMILKPEQGGSGARMYLVNSLNELELLLKQQPELWEPDNLLLLQEKLEHETAEGIIRLEFIDGKLLYAMRVVTNGTFNLCPSVVCNPEEGTSLCEVIPGAKPEFFALKDVSSKAVDSGKEIMKAAGHSSGSVEFLITKDGRMVFYDINSNSNLRESIANEFGKNAFEEVVKFLLTQVKN